MLEVSRRTIRLLWVATFLFAVPLFHIGVPYLLAHVGPRWGWNGGYPGPLNFLSAVPIFTGAVLLVWILKTMLVVARSLPPRVRLGFRPAQLIQIGPYAWVRHPIYVAESCFWLGIIVLFGSPFVAAPIEARAGKHLKQGVMLAISSLLSILLLT
jgi:protein-S-isoprenylcysteine O-methyltransferase Ste14